MILDDIIRKRREQLDREKSERSSNDLKDMAFRCIKADRRFRRAIDKDGLSVIAEVKKASPSRGLIKADFDPAKIAEAYEQAGADAISVLTEEFFFMGSMDYLRQVGENVKIPILCKDFIIDDYQIYHAAASGASAVLLIVAILGAEKLRAFQSLANTLGLDCLVETHDECEIRTAVESGAGIIGINNRDLRTFKVDLGTTIRLAKHIPDGCSVVSESGIASNDDMKLMRSVGVNAVLIGETLMKSENMAKTLDDLRNSR